MAGRTLPTTAKVLPAAPGRQQHVGNVYTRRDNAQLAMDLQGGCVGCPATQSQKHPPFRSGGGLMVVVVVGRIANVSHHGHGDEREADRLQQAGDSAADFDAAQHMAKQRGEEEETRLVL